MGLFAGLLPWNAIASMRQKGARATARRLLDSRHVADLRLIVSIFLFLFIIGLLLLLFYGAENGFAGPRWSLLAALSGAITAFLVSLINWVYQTGSKRLGVVDLFACEIAAICRVYAVVGMARRLIHAYHYPAAFGSPTYRSPDSISQSSEHPPAAEQHREREPSVNATNMKITESYTPVMDHDVEDLQQLDAEVVTNVTEFYTYRRAMLDYMYRWGQENPPTSDDDGKDNLWHYFLLQTIYMLFLSLESARRALDDLIEYEPNHAESRINILLSELPTFSFLMTQTANDPLRHKRLALRLADYDEIFRTCYDSAVAPHTADIKAWQRAKTSAEDLKACYDQAMRALGVAQPA